MFKEISCLYANNKILSVTTGTQGGVEFDFFSAWEEWKKNPFPYLLMIHSHPSHFLQMSQTDVNMVSGWAKAFPVPIFFAIVCKGGEDGIDDVIVHIVTNQNKTINITNPMGFSEDSLDEYGLLHRILFASHLIDNEQRIIDYIFEWKEHSIFKIEFLAKNKNENKK